MKADNETMPRAGAGIAGSVPDSVTWTERHAWLGPKSSIEWLTSETQHQSNLMFVHGWGLSARSYAAPLTHLAASFNVVAPTMPGFGHSSPLPRGSARGLQGYADAILVAWELAQLPAPMPIVTHSMGSGVAVKMAITRPDLVSSLTLTCPIGGDGEISVPWTELVKSLAREVQSAPLLPRFFDSGPAMLRHPAITARAAYIAKHARLYDDIRTILDRGIPVTLVVARDDGVVRPGRLPLTGANVVEVPGGHGFPLHQPRYFTNLVQRSIAGTL